MTVLAQIKAKECNCGTILAIFIIFIKLQKIIKMHRKFIFKHLLCCLTHTVNFKLIRQVVFMQQYFKV